MNVANFQTPSARPNYNAETHGNYTITAVEDTLFPDYKVFDIVPKVSGVMYLTISGIKSLPATEDCLIYINGHTISHYIKGNPNTITILVEKNLPVGVSSGVSAFNMDNFQISLIPYK